jgi:hypothetical protein
MLKMAELYDEVLNSELRRDKGLYGIFLYAPNKQFLRLRPIKKKRLQKINNFQDVANSKN